MNLCVILVQGPCQPFLYCYNFSVCAAEANTTDFCFSLIPSDRPTGSVKTVPGLSEKGSGSSK